MTFVFASRLSDDLRMDETATIRESIVQAGLSEDLLTRWIHVLPGSQVNAACRTTKRRKTGLEEEFAPLLIEETKMVMA